MRAFLWTIALSIVLFSQGVQASESRDNLSKSLTQSLQALGSFQAQYRAVSPHKKALISLQYNQQKKFCLAKVEVQEKPDIWIVLDYANMAVSPTSTFHLYLISGLGGRWYNVSLMELFERLDNPLGIANFMHKILDPNAPAFITPGEGSPKIRLGLSDSQLNINFEIAVKKGALRASWSDKNALNAAEKVESSSEKVTLYYKDNHSISIDPRNGLLLLDSWPKQEEASPREIRLVSHSELKIDKDYIKQIPNFDKMSFKKMPLNSLSRDFYPSYFKHLTTELEKIENFQQTIQSLSPSVLKRLAAQKILGYPPLKLNPEQTKEYLKQVLMPYYQKLKEKDSTQKMSFLTFLKRLLREVDSDKFPFMTPVARQFTSQLHQQMNQIVLNIPANRRAPVRALMTKGIKPVFDAWVSHYFRATIGQAIELVEKDESLFSPALPIS